MAAHDSVAGFVSSWVQFISESLIVTHLVLLLILFFFKLISDERLTAEEMDEQRIQNVAYQYLCRLEEAKRQKNHHSLFHLLKMNLCRYC